MTDLGPVRIGTMIAGRYRIDRVLGQGGMGVVVQATHLQLHRQVAIKFILPEVLGTPQIVQRFMREAQAAVQLTSEHVARVLDVGTLESGAPYMVLEYLEGTDLSTIPHSQLTVGGIVDLVLQACEALAEAHALGIVHRDIKPANFFVTRRADGTPLLKLLDFGVSKTSSMNDKLTASRSVMGTPAYMSPEQMRSSRDVDHRTDIWSVGVVLYELLQGAPPFGSETFPSMVLKVVNEPLPRLTVRLPGDLDEVVYRCLQKDPTRRFQSTAALAHALASYAHSETQAAISVQRTQAIAGNATPPPALIAGRAPPSTLSGAAGARTTRKAARRRLSFFVATGVLACAVVAMLATAGSERRTRLSPGAQPATAPSSAQPTEIASPVPAAPTQAPVPIAPRQSPGSATPLASKTTAVAPPASRAAVRQPDGVAAIPPAEHQSDGTSVTKPPAANQPDRAADVSQPPARSDSPLQGSAAQTTRSPTLDSRNSDPSSAKSNRPRHRPAKPQSPAADPILERRR